MEEETYRSLKGNELKKFIPKKLQKIKEEDLKEAIRKEINGRRI